MKHFQKFLKFQKQYQYIQKDDRVLVAFSGGPDSVFLVEMLQELQKSLEFEMVLVHLHHGIRGREADADYEFCKSYASKYQLDYVREKRDVLSYAKEQSKSVEEAGRILRYELFDRVIQEKKCNKLATGHHLDDHLETFFFRLLRGSSLESLAGISRKKGKLIRPLRDFEKKEILEYLEQEKISFCQDLTNQETDYTRNKLRLCLLPQLEEYNPKWKEKISALMGEIEERKEEDSIDLEQYWDEEEAGKIKVTKLQKEKPYQQKKILYEYMLSKQILGNRKQVDKIYTLLKRGGSLSYDLKNSWKFRKEYDKIWIEFQPEKPEEKLGEKELLIPGTTLFGRYRISTSFAGEEEKENVWFFWEEGEIVKLRTYQAGDRIQLRGFTSPKKLKEILINLKIPKEKRRILPILEYRGEILSVANLIRAEEKISRNETEKKVMVKIEEVKH